jgi:RNA polymerase sigma factor (TIGR02999 family)
MADALTRTLSEVRRGDPDAIARLMSLVYEPLRALAGRCFRGQAAGQTLQPTALVHEVFLRLAGRGEQDVRDRAHFFAICATAMRGILTDHARRRRAGKRGGARQRVTLSLVGASPAGAAIDVLDLDEVLAQLAQLSERQARIVEYRVFAGLTLAEIAQALGVSKRTIDGDWAMARAWISVRMGERC